jgi:Uma2 family endonuclease
LFRAAATCCRSASAISARSTIDAAAASRPSARALGELRHPLVDALDRLDERVDPLRRGRLALLRRGVLHQLIDGAPLLAERLIALVELGELRRAPLDLLPPRRERRRGRRVPLARGRDRLHEPAERHVHALLPRGGLRRRLRGALEGLARVERLPARRARELVEAPELALERPRGLGEIAPARVALVVAALALLAHAGERSAFKGSRLPAMGQAVLRTHVSEQEYLAFERASEERHEYADGEIFAMSGGTWEHSLIASNITGELRAALGDRPCTAHGSDMRIHIPSTGRYTYADALIVCDKPVFTDEVRDTLVNPVVIVEVLSDSTERYDRGDKFEQYQTIASLREYVLVSQKKARIEHFRKQADGTWVLRVTGPGERLALDSARCELVVDRCYLKVFGQAAS